VNKIDRVREALAGRPVDRVPASFWTHFEPEAANGKEMARAHIEFYRSTGPDFLKVMNDNPFELVGIERVSSPSDWLRLKPNSRKSRVRQNYLDGLKEILDVVGQECMVIVTMFNPFATANDNMSGTLDFSDAGFEGITNHLREDPRSTCAGLQIIAQSLAEFTQDCIELGASGLFLSANGGERDRFNASQFSEYIAADDCRILQAAIDAGSEFNLLHVCGSGLRLESYAKYPAHAVNWATQASNPSLKQGRELFSQTLAGGLDQAGAITSGSFDNIAYEVSAAIAEAGRLNFILGAGCALESNVPAANLIAAREAVLHAG
jgi:uroporphyrinogen decarboxylase